MNNIDRQYKELLEHILHFGTEKKDRTGVGTKSVFGYQIRHNMKDGFPLLTTKKMYFKGIATELIWFLNGDTNIRYLVDNDCHIWDGDAYKNYCKYTSQNSAKWNEWMRDNGDGTLSMFTQEEFIIKIKTDDKFAGKWGDLGPIYGKQWRDWHVVDFGIDREANGDSYHMHFDQIKNLINDLKNNPDSRRLMVSAWNAAEVDKAVLPPCHYGFQCWTRELTFDERVKWYKKNFEFLPELNLLNGETYITNILNDSNVPARAISLMWNQRSVDTFLGLPFNIASYGLLLEIIAKEVNMIPDELIGNLGDTHIYLNHIDAVKEQIKRSSFGLPKLVIKDEVKWNEEDCLPSYSPSDFKIENYQFQSLIKATLNN